ncbi:acyl-CoA dehydrogenase C-terminal domain-containing protein [Parendozoicomonas haliclonae]|uniref:3-methylmercaptopropionyl-CoA dehydrogenase n=1 Tax=Parendozoicomonas haliclonae TaxID=1960125 RepID=A0A1X7AP96_9GAMM|nr:acyl-CoA dehydrogenase C-terminal domain-containing protein [Parendozoicomonas haliclonae]SMA49942.1 Acyl-CoA dehydrogenase [Parendozoicomonas haliclonae]
MPDYKVPLRDFDFVMSEVLGFEQHYASLPGGEDATPDMVKAVLEEGAKFVEGEIVPLNRSGDEESAQWNDGVVTTPEGFKAAYDKLVENGWCGLSQPQKLGGQGLPSSLNTAFYEMLAGSSLSWAIYPTLTWGAIETMAAHAPEELKANYLPPMVQGLWSGTMCLTEAHCGSDLGLLKTRAEPNEDGSYSLTGSKIFITGGEHDLTENIVHIVLARLPDAPEGVKGISLFVVPKYNVNADGSLGERNTVSCGSIEHKMGIKASATCVMNFDGAKGFLIGAPNKGMACMFTFINESRLGVAVQGQSTAEHSFQGALAYARERLQMKGVPRHSPAKPADPIIVHPDVRRMLLTQKAIAEGGRMLNMYCAKLVDLKHGGTVEQKADAEQRLAMLTPIAKGFLTEAAQEATKEGIQVFGGHGFIREWGMEQLSRDVRITAIYEGTTTIQGLDLLGRKILPGDGRLLTLFTKEISDFASQQLDNPELASMAQALIAKVELWQSLTGELSQRLQDAGPNELNSAAVDYLMFSGYMMLGYFWLQAAAVASKAEGDFYTAKVQTANFYFKRLLPRTTSLAETIRDSADTLTAMDEDAFVF